jgi:hypothetical protein
MDYGQNNRSSTHMLQTIAQYNIKAMKGGYEE